MQRTGQKFHPIAPPEEVYVSRVGGKKADS